MTQVIEPGTTARPPAWHVETAGPGDRPAVEALFARCSPPTVRQRFFGPVKAIPPAYLADVLAGRPEIHDAVVGHAGDRAHLAGLAGLAALPPEDGHRAGELGMLVADAEQRLGLGAAMLGVLLARARERGVTRVVASVPPDGRELLAALGRRPELEPAGSRAGAGVRTAVYRLS